jgi:hypothetical protein
MRRIFGKRETNKCMGLYALEGLGNIAISLCHEDRLLLNDV